MRLFCYALFLLVLLAICSVIPASAGPDAAASGSWAGKKDCQFLLPPDWAGRETTWFGSCVQGKAHGQGVLRASKGGADVLLYMGSLDHGALEVGVIDCSDGYIAGQFNGGKLLPDLDRNVVIEAFNKASAAALSNSRHFAKMGNKASAAFYVKKSKMLKEQMD
jgi:hypothetical protein